MENLSASRRVQRYEKEIRQLSSEYVMFSLKMPTQSMVTVTRVQVSPDLRSAKVYVHFMGDEKQFPEDLKILNSQTYQMQSYIHSKLRSKYCTKVTFYLDKGYENVMKVEKILSQIAQNQ